jgi:hypothetical protein
MRNTPAHHRRSKGLSMILMAVFVIITTGACAAEYTDAQMEPLAVTASDIARAVRYYVKKHPNEAVTLTDQELVKQATAHDPNLLVPYGDFVVMGTPEGIVLVCTKDQTRGLIEDVECSDKVDGMNWRSVNKPCSYTLDIAVVCSGM